MQSLRWTLLILGVVFVALLAWWERRRPRQASGRPERSTTHESFADTPAPRMVREPPLTLPEMRAREPLVPLPIERARRRARRARTPASCRCCASCRHRRGRGPAPAPCFPPLPRRRADRPPPRRPRARARRRR